MRRQWRKRALYSMGLHGERKGPMPYVCGQCGAHGVKLWREAGTFLSHQTLRCARCCTTLEVDAQGMVPLADTSEAFAGFTGRTDQIGSWRVPAVPSPGGSFWGYCAVPDDAAEAATKQHPVDLRFWQERVADLEDRTASERRRQAELQRIADRLPAIEAAEAKLDGLRADKATADAATATTELDAARDADSAAIAARNGTQAALQELEQEETSLGPWLKLEAPLAAATARIAELTELLGEHERELAAAAKEQKELPQPVWPQARPIPEAQARLQVAKAEHATTLLKVGQLQATRDTVAPLQAERDERHAEVQTAEDDVSDWQLLADALGRNGIQALEADAAGPELSAIANDLLHNAFGPRFTVRFETTRASADGKELIEDYDVMILDTLKGREGSLDTFSGGEKVILGEAISLALTTLSCRRHGLSDVTLLRDESGASLDAEKSLQYIAMLRRARTLTDARHVIFISHDPATWRLADTRVVVADGTLTVHTEAA